jgi:large subunit ribosomal protein L6
MSRIGRKPITVPSGVDLTIGDGNAITVKGPKGTLSHAFSPDLAITRENGTITVERPSDDRRHRSLHGLSRTLLSNMVVGVTDGFTKTLDISGVGYRAAMDGKALVLTVGFSHPVRIQPAEGVSFAVEGTNRVIVSGFDKQAVGEEAARIRRVRPPEPYKGKGIRYEGERIRRKAGKAGKAK